MAKIVNHRQSTDSLRIAKEYTDTSKNGLNSFRRSVPIDAKVAHHVAHTIRQFSEQQIELIKHLSLKVIALSTNSLHALSKLLPAFVGIGGALRITSDLMNLYIIFRSDVKLSQKIVDAAFTLADIGTSLPAYILYFIVAAKPAILASSSFFAALSPISAGLFITASCLDVVQATIGAIRPILHSIKNKGKPCSDNQKKLQGFYFGKALTNLGFAALGAAAIATWFVAPPFALYAGLALIGLGVSKVVVHTIQSRKEKKLKTAVENEQTNTADKPVKQSGARPAPAPAQTHTEEKKLKAAVENKQTNTADKPVEQSGARPVPEQTHTNVTLRLGQAAQVRRDETASPQNDAEPHTNPAPASRSLEDMFRVAVFGASAKLRASDRKTCTPRTHMPQNRV